MQTQKWTCLVSDPTAFTVHGKNDLNIPLWNWQGLKGHTYSIEIPLQSDKIYIGGMQTEPTKVFLEPLSIIIYRFNTGDT